MLRKLVRFLRALVRAYWGGVETDDNEEEDSKAAP